LHAENLGTLAENVTTVAVAGMMIERGEDEEMTEMIRERSKWSRFDGVMEKSEVFLKFMKL
jgi:hypothetical protein